MGHLLQVLLLALCFVVVHSTLSSRQSDFNLPNYFAKQRGWTQTLTGQTGAKGNTQPRGIRHTACGSKYFVAWTARTGESQNKQHTTFWDEITVGHITQFSVSAQGVPTMVRDVAFPGCNEMGNIHCSADGTIIAAMCRSSVNSIGGAPTIDFVAKNKDASGNVPFGWDQSTQAGSVVDRMFLLEFASGQITSRPSSSVKINHAIGGWNYGHFEVTLNAAKTVYLISMKTTIFGGGSWHEGSVQFEMNRGSWTLNSPSAWACGGGHTEANRAVYNPFLNKFALFCKTDLSNNNRGPNAAYYTTDVRKKAVEIQAYPLRAEPRAFWHGNGGPMNLLPTRTGFLGAGLGPGGEGQPITVGIINLPGDHETFRPSTSAFKWIDLPRTTVDNRPMPQTGFPKIGYVNLSPIGRSGSTYLTGWAIMDSESKQHHVAEINGEGCIYGNTLAVPGWGQDDVWTYSPVSGCVLMPYVWRDNADSGSRYGECQQCASVESTLFSKKLRIISVCSSTVPSASRPQCAFITAPRNAAVSEETATLDSSASTVSPWVWVGVGAAALVVVAVVVVAYVTVLKIRSPVESV